MRNRLLESAVLPIFLYSLSLIPLLTILFFTREAVYHAWKKFMIFMSTFLAFLIFTPRPSGGSGGGFYDMGVSTIDRETGFMFLIALFFIISIFIIIIKSILVGISERREKRESVKEVKNPSADFHDFERLKRLILRAEKTESDKMIIKKLRSRGWSTSNIEQAFLALGKKW